MWARPTMPEIQIQAYIYSNHAVFNNSIDTTKAQDVAKCRSHKGFPGANLAFFDMITGAKLTADNDVECFSNSARQEVLDCSLTLKRIITKEMDQSQYRCEMTHPALRGVIEETSKTLTVHYPPYDLVMRGNITEKTITCMAKSNPLPTYYYKIGKVGSVMKIGNGFLILYAKKSTNI
jgi:hypothetical protein